MVEAAVWFIGLFQEGAAVFYKPGIRYRSAGNRA